MSVPLYPTFADREIAAERCIPQGSWRHDAEASRRGRHLTVYAVRSTTDPEREYECVFHHGTDRWYCTCEARKVCKHLRGLIYWREFDSMLALFRQLDWQERDRRMADYAAIARGDLVPYRFWQIDRDAMQTTMAERQGARQQDAA